MKCCSLTQGSAFQTGLKYKRVVWNNANDFYVIDFEIVFQPSSDFSDPNKNLSFPSSAPTSSEAFPPTTPGPFHA
ncbi:MAG: hypothetical protein K8R45_06810, partial [Desulfobacterales bacterium]|nr:hypothetical protein [Desulfobacterales bacterium]